MIRRRRLVAGAALTVVALAIAGVLALPAIVRQVVIWQLAAVTGRTVTLAGLEIELFGGRLALRDLRVIDHDQQPLATLVRLEVAFAPRELLRGRLRIASVTLEAPALRIVRTGPHRFNVSDLLARETGGGRAPAVTVERLALRGGSVAIEDRTLTPPRTWRVETLTADGRDLSTVPEAPTGVVTVSAVAAGSPLTLWVSGVRLSPLAFHATAIAREIDASLAALYLPPDSPLTPAKGRLDASATIDRDAGGIRAALDAVFGGVELRRPGQAVPFLWAPAVRVTVEDLRAGAGGLHVGRVAVDAGDVVAEDARLAPARRWWAEGVVVEARNLSSDRNAPPGVGVARAVIAGAPLTVWAGNFRLAPLEIHATAVVRNVDFALFRLYLPPDLPVQPERGIVNASVRIDHDARGTRLALDAGLSGVELRRPGHFVTAPALRVTAEDIGFTDGAVTVGRVSVGGARLTLEDRTLSPPRTWAVQDLAVEASRLSSRRHDVQGVATARATVAGASVAAWVTHVRLDPVELRATVILRNLDLPLVRLYLPPVLPVQLDRGLVNASVQVDHDTAAGTRLAGDVTLTGVTARGRDHDGRLDLERLRFAGEGLTWPIQGPARVTVSARFPDGGELDASGTALLTAPPPMLAWTSELAVQLRAVEVAPLAPYVAAASGVRGRLDGSVNATVAYGASVTASVRGDVRGSGFALVDGGRTLLALRRFDATGLDIVWPERIGVGRLRLQRPRALIERDARGAFPLVQRVAPPAPPAPDVPARPGPTVSAGEVVVERGTVTFVDGAGAAPVRIEVPRVDLTLRDARWPAVTPARLRLDATLPTGGTVAVEGTVSGPADPVDLRVAVADAELALVQPYLPFRARVRARVDTTMAIAGTVWPEPRLNARGEATVRRLAIADGARTVLAVERLAAAGIDAAWPERVTIEQVRLRRSWALIERDRQGRFLFRTLFERTPGPATSSTTLAPTPGPAVQFRLVDGLFEEGSATIVDEAATPPARIDLAGARLGVRDFTWPSQGPATLDLASPAPGGGRLAMKGTLNVDPIRLEARASLDAVELAPAQSYLPIDGRVAGRVTGELAVTMTVDPLAVKVGGDARLQRFRLSDGERPVVTVGRAEALGIDVDWPARIAVERVLFRRPSVLIERDAGGAFTLGRLITPRRGPTAPAGSGPAATDGTPATPIDIGTFKLERAAARFVDQTTVPAYAEQLSDVDATFTGLTTARGRRARFAGTGALGGGAKFRFEGQGEAGDQPVLEVKVDLRDFALPRANPYLDRFTAWTATRGTLTASASYSLVGTRIEARHEVIVRHAEVEASEAGDEVERRLGLPLGVLVALLKDARGEIRLSVPVSGDLSTREFDFGEAVWGAVRNLAIRLLALPFSKVGSLFFSEDSRVEAVSLTPVMFEAGTTTLAAAMAGHLDRVAVFLREAPAVRLRLAPILIQADVDALKRDRKQAGLGEDLPPDALHDLGTRRLDAVRQALTARGIDAGRIEGSARRVPLVEAAGAARVELDLRTGRDQ